MNVGIAQLKPGVFGVCHGGGLAGEIIRDATGSEAGHAMLYLGGGLMVQGKPPKADIVPADTYQDAIWAWRMWDQLVAVDHWTLPQVTTSQTLVVARGHALDGTLYDWAAYPAFAAEVLHLRNEGQLAPWFDGDKDRVCSALVDDAEVTGKVPMVFVPEDGPELTTRPGMYAAMPPNLVAPGMLLGLAMRKDWI